MNERLKDTLHRWLPKLAILSLLVLLSSFVFLDFYVVPRRTAAVEDRDEQRHRIREDEQARAGEAKAALERIVGLIDTLDGNQADPRGPERSGGSRGSHRRGMGDQCPGPHCVLRPA